MALIVLVLLLRAAIPAGYMLAPGEGALPRLVPCPGAAPAATNRHHGGVHSGDRPDNGSASDIPCAFALVLAPALPAPPPALAPALLLPPPPFGSLPAVAALPPDSAALRPPATGPPARA